MCKNYPKEFPEEFITTAFGCEMFGEWNDIINNRDPSMAMFPENDYKSDYKRGKLSRFTEVFGRMKLHKKQRMKFKPSQKGVIITTASLFWILDILFKKYGYHYFLTAK